MSLWKRWAFMNEMEMVDKMYVQVIDNWHCEQSKFSLNNIIVWLAILFDYYLKKRIDSSFLWLKRQRNKNILLIYRLFVFSASSSFCFYTKFVNSLPMCLILFYLAKYTFLVWLWVYNIMCLLYCSQCCIGSTITVIELVRV